MATFPDVLVVHAKKFQLINWVPSKLGELRYMPMTASAIMLRFTLYRHSRHPPSG